MAYAALNKSGCDVRKGNCQLRLDFFLDEGAPRYADRYLYLVDTTSDEYLAGYKGEVGKDGQPIDQADYDKWYEELPRIWQNTPFHSHFVYFDSDFTDEDIKRAIELHLPNFYKAFQEENDKDAGGMRRGWATETRIKPTDYPKTESVAKYKARAAKCQQALNNLTAFSYKPDGDGEGKLSPATEIDIGSGAIDRITTVSLTSTMLDKTNPANADGSLDTLEIWLSDAGTGVKEGTFYGSGTSYTPRDYQTLGNVSAGSKQSFTGLSIDVETGDVLGVYGDSGQVERDGSGGSGLYYKSGDQFDAGTQTYAYWAAYPLSLYGTGETAVVDDHRRSAFFPFM